MNAFRHSYRVSPFDEEPHCFYYHAECVERNPPEPSTLFQEIGLSEVPQDTLCQFCDEDMHGKSGYEQQAEWNALYAKYSPPEVPEEDTETRAIKALVADIQSNLLESDALSSVDNFGEAGFHDRKANAIEDMLLKIYDVRIEEDEEDEELLHIFKDARHWKDLDLANWQWLDPESENAGMSLEVIEE